MSLHPQPIPEIPTATREVAKAALRKDNLCIQMRDNLGTLYTDEDFAELYAVRGRPGEAAWQLALVTVFQFVEGLTDQQAADAVCSRIDWKYALSLELEDKGFDASVLSEFRTRLVEGAAAMKLLDIMLKQFKAAGYVKARGKQRTDSTHVLAAVRMLNRLELLGETLRHALDTLAISAPEWLKPRIQPGWLERYERRFEQYRLPKTKREQAAFASQIGDDGRQLLQAICAAQSPKWLRELPAVRVLQRVWLEQYYAVEDGAPMRWREEADQAPSSRRIHSPYDPEARYSTKRETSWLGYKAHITESCDEDEPHLITHVITEESTTPDYNTPATIHAALAEKELLPAEHYLDAGYVDADLLVTSQESYAVQVIGPVSPDHSWQAHTEEAYDISRFIIDWDAQHVTCPQGHRSQKWWETHDQYGEPIINTRFAQTACKACPVRQQCTRSASGPRSITLRPRPAFDALQTRRQEQQTPEFKQKYKRRAGVEGTISQAVRRTDVRHTRYIGLAKLHLQHVVSAVAINLYRITDYLANRETRSGPSSPFASRRRSAFAALASA